MRHGPGSVVFALGPLAIALLAAGEPPEAGGAVDPAPAGEIGATPGEAAAG